MIRTVLLDADETLFDFKMSESVALRKTMTRLGIPVSDENIALYSAINDSYWKRLERKEVTRSELRVRRFADLLDALHSDRSAEEAASIYEVLLAEGHFFLPGAEALLQELYGKYDLYITSNGYARTQKGRLASAGAEHFFKGVFISQELGADKPDPAFFDACFAAIPNLDRKKTVIVGDSLTSDILGGLQAGIWTVWFRHRPSQKPIEGITPHHTIEHLDQLPALLDGWDQIAR